MDNQRYKRAYATLSVYSTILSVDELRQRIPIEPDETVQKGTPRSGKKPGNVHRTSMLGFKSRLARSATPEDQVADLLDVVRPAKEEISQYANQANVEDPDARMHIYVRLVVETNERMFGFDLGPYLQDMLDLRAGFGIEIDVHDEDDEDEHRS